MNLITSFKANKISLVEVTTINKKIFKVTYVTLPYCMLSYVSMLRVFIFNIMLNK